MNDTATTDDVFRAIEAGFRSGFPQGQQTVADLYAEDVLFHHDPPHPADRVRRKTELADAQRAEGAAFGATIKDFRQEDVRVSLEDDQVVVAAVLRGTLPDGSPLHVPINLRYTVVAGAITEMLAIVDGGEQLSGGHPEA